MKKGISKQIFSLLQFFVFLALLLGCTSEPKSSYSNIYSIQCTIIDIKGAEAFALRFANLKETDVEFTRSELLGQGGYNIFEFEFTCDSNKYKCYINKDKGIVIKYDFDGFINNNGSMLSYAQITEILEIIAPDIDIDTINMDVDKENDDGLTVYEGEASSDAYTYTFEIHAYSGTLVEWETTNK